jgi:hypothetical protein
MMEAPVDKAAGALANHTDVNGFAAGR